LDSDIRLWVFLPIVVITFLVGIIRHYVTILLSTEKKVELQQISDRYSCVYKGVGKFLPLGGKNRGFPWINTTPAKIGIVFAGKNFFSIQWQTVVMIQSKERVLNCNGTLQNEIARWHKPNTSAKSNSKTNPKSNTNPI